MTWTNFLITLIVLYIFYYGVVIVLDLFNNSKRVDNSESTEVLVFEENHKVKSVDDLVSTKEEKKSSINLKVRKEESNNEKETPQKEEKNQASTVENDSGGLELNQLLKLVRQESIIKTSQIDFG